MMMMDDGDEIIHLISVLWMDMKEMMMIAMHTQMLRNSDVVVFTTIITIVQNRDLFNDMELVNWLLFPWIDKYISTGDLSIVT